MILLNFSVKNHKSLRDGFILDLTKPSLRTLQPSNKDWHSVTYTLAGVFGGNATGKSTLLEALIYTFHAIAHSATSWQDKKVMPRRPFLLDDTSVNESSIYELDFVLDNVRHIYGFEVDTDGIVREWLRDLPKTRWRTLIDRDRHTGILKISSSLNSKISVSKKELILSRALVIGDSPLANLAKRMIDSFDFISVSDLDRSRRISHLTESLVEGKASFKDLVTLLQVADIGVSKVDVRETQLPPVLKDLLRTLRSSGLDNEAKEDQDNLEQHDLSEDDFEQLARELIFTHHGQSKVVPEFSLHQESDGTIAWLAIAVPALEVLRNGGILVVDEIDASLHPHLVEVLLAAFDDPSINSQHAQLIFASHDAYILSPLIDVHLEPEQIWFTEKDAFGATELISLAEFPKHRDANIAKRYLLGRYGGVPRLDPNAFEFLIKEEDSSHA